MAQTPSTPQTPHLQAGAGGNDQEDAIPGTVTAAGAAAAAGMPRPVFRYWVDEILWSQGRVATIQIEEVLDAMGGQRTGGPHKLLTSSGKPSTSTPPLAALTMQHLELTSSCAAHPGPSAAAAVAAAAGANLSSSRPQPDNPDQPGSSSSAAQTQQRQRSSVSRNSSSSQLTSGGSSSSSLDTAAATDPTAAAAAAVSDALTAAAAAGAASDNADSSSGLGPSKRPDDHLLGYHHVRQWDLLWTKSVYAIKAARLMQPGQVVSAIAGLNCLTMKKRMVQTLRMALGTKAFAIVPLSFCIPEDLPAWQAWLATSNGAAADTGLWMLKTGQDAGKGLRLVRTQNALQVALRPPKNPAKPQSHIKVAQQYITNPLLIEGRKFHLRLWLLVTSHCPLRAYLHNQGLVLFSSEVYDQSRPVDGPGVKPSVGHVTNYARNEDTWVWGLDQLQQQLGQEQWQELWQEMQRSSALTAAAVLGPMRAAHRWLQPSIGNYGFQMLGLDYLVDEQLHPWLLEVNSAPSIMAVHSDPGTCGLIKSTKQAMLTDMLAMVQHRVLPQDCAAVAASEAAAAAAGSGGSRVMSWQEELAAEMANRGGFEPLMSMFPLQQGSIPWQEQDVQLQRMLQQQQV